MHHVLKRGHNSLDWSPDLEIFCFPFEGSTAAPQNEENIQNVPQNSCFKTYPNEEEGSSASC